MRGLFTFGGFMIQRIAVISTSISPVMIRAVYQDGELILEERKALPSRRKKMLDDLSKELPKMVKAGFKVIVDEVSGEIAQRIGAANVLLSSKHADGRPVIVVAFQRLGEMKRQGSIIYPAKGKGLYEIPSSLVYVDYSPAGEPIYRIDWETLKAEHVLMLLTVYSTMYNNVASSAYIKAMQSTSSIDESQSPIKSFLNLISSHEESVEKKTPKGKLTGTRIDENTVVL